MPPTSNISVIIVSRNRPVHLNKMLGCLRLQDIAGFEVLVVTNTADKICGKFPEGRFKAIPFEAANIAAARNIGVKNATGDFVAFCDDDALPDPGWLRKITACFDDPEVAAAGGFTRGRNGISLQWGAVLTDQLAREFYQQLTKTTVFEPDNGRAPVMIGTNAVFRKSALDQIGGFDEVFAYYLDDSDISFRLSQAGWKLALLPDCQVHHSFAASAHRSTRRVPISLFSLGRSKAYYCRKHGDNANTDAVLKGFKQSHYRKLEKLFLIGLIDGNQFVNLQKTLNSGIESGLKTLILPRHPTKMEPSAKRVTFQPKDRHHIVIAARRKQMIQADKVARELTKSGHRVTVITLGYTALYMQVMFSDKGYWHHKGGQFGKIDRAEPLWRWQNYRVKILNECRRITQTRPIDFLTFLEPAAMGASLLPEMFGMSSLNDYKVLDDSSLWSNQGKELT